MPPPSRPLLALLEHAEIEVGTARVTEHLAVRVRVGRVRRVEADVEHGDALRVVGHRVRIRDRRADELAALDLERRADLRVERLVRELAVDLAEALLHVGAHDRRVGLALHRDDRRHVLGRDRRVLAEPVEQIGEHAGEDLDPVRRRRRIASGRVVLVVEVHLLGIDAPTEPVDLAAKRARGRQQVIRARGDRAVADQRVVGVDVGEAARLRRRRRRDRRLVRWLVLDGRGRGSDRPSVHRPGRRTTERGDEQNRVSHAETTRLAAPAFTSIGRMRP